MGASTGANAPVQFDTGAFAPVPGIQAKNPLLEVNSRIIFMAVMPWGATLIEKKRERGIITRWLASGQ
jgi:hypothetical protein